MRGLVALSAAVAVGSGWVLADRLEDTFYVPLDHPAILYYQEPTDPVARLQTRLANGQTKLDFGPNRGYLAALLKELDINVDSQVLVFSKSSIQTSHISPRTPRAIYFNDDVAVGYVQGGDALELSALDLRLGEATSVPLRGDQLDQGLHGAGAYHPRLRGSQEGAD